MAYMKRVPTGRKRGSYVDWQIWQQVWRWAKRRHPNKGLRWLKGRYFPSHSARQWVFTGVIERGREVHLGKAAATPIQRHVKVRGTANPYDPAHVAYFARRRAKGRVYGPQGCSGGHHVVFRH